jgi:2-polyprenyl-6-methoxyphenol hydroxylase-like FAD-dependent oxidoreductase
LLGPEIAPHVKYSANVKSYTIHGDSVEAHLASGESIHGSLLVGADGIRSNIAAQLFASANIPAERTRTLDLGVRIVYGKAPLTPVLLERMNKGLHKGMAFIVDSVKLPPKKRVMVVVKAMNFDHSISTADKVKAGAGDVQTPGDYVFFAMVSRKELWQDALKRMSPASAVIEKEKEAEHDIDDRLVRLTGQGAKDLSLFVARERFWDPSVLTLLEGQDASQTAVLRTTSSNPAGPPLWESNERVTLLGDAVHCMPPTGGQGGNMALWDGALLGQELAEEWEAQRAARVWEEEQKGEEVGWKWSRGTIRRYEDSMRAHTGDIVAMACIGATYLFGGEEVWRQ